MVYRGGHDGRNLGCGDMDGGNEMNAVWKYELSLRQEQRIEMPVGAKILHVAEQHGILCLWALVAPGANRVNRRLMIAGTGHLTVPQDEWTHVGTALCDGGEFVWHVFDGGEV